MTGFQPGLLSAARQVELAGNFPLRYGWNGPQLWLDCAECGRGVYSLSGTSGRACAVRAGELLSAVLLHQVRHHGLSLSGARTEPGPCYGQNCDHVSHGARGPDER